MQIPELARIARTWAGVLSQGMELRVRVFAAGRGRGDPVRSTGPVRASGIPCVHAAPFVPPVLFLVTCHGQKPSILVHLAHVSSWSATRTAVSSYPRTEGGARGQQDSVRRRSFTRREW